MKKRIAIVIGVVAVIILVLLAGFLSVRSRVEQTEKVLGPGTDDLSSVQKMRIALQCFEKLEQYSKPVNPSKERFLLEIEQDEGVASVIGKISDGLGIEADFLRLYWIYTGADRLINPGRYVLSGSMTAAQITDLVTSAGKALVQFAFFSGMRLEEIAELIDSYGFVFSGADFLELAKNYPPALHPAGMTSLEGYFVPGTYEMSRGISLEDFLSNFMNVFRRRVQEPYEAAFRTNGLTLNQAVIMASMIAREAMSESEYGLIASVFYNRIAAGMKFESDPTAQYAIGYDEASGSWWKMPLTAADVAIYSPYNTYAADGFPPGPICNASTAIFEAVAYPEQTDYYYFRARCDNTPYHNFSRTFAEHVAFGCE